MGLMATGESMITEGEGREPRKVNVQVQKEVSYRVQEWYQYRMVYNCFEVQSIR